eukprot:scaffold12556_cov44-Cyclotella_meneghiniana.AAC.9
MMYDVLWLWSPSPAPVTYHKSQGSDAHVRRAVMVTLIRITLHPLDRARTNYSGRTRPVFGAARQSTVVSAAQAATIW